MVQVTNEDRLSVLENKLKEAESAIYGCRAMLNYVRRMDNETQATMDLKEDSGDPRRKGLYPGQVDNYIESSGDTGRTEGEQECVE